MVEAEARRWKRERDARGIGEARERGDKRKEDFRVRVCVRVCERARAASWKDRKAERSEDAAKFPSSLEEGLPVRSPSDPRAVAGARLRGRCFRVTRTTPKN